MSLRIPGRLLLLAVTAAAVAAGCTSPPEPARTVVLVSIDTLRADHLPAYGYTAVETPALDALRREAILFTSAWSPVPLTLPAHASMLSGRLPFEHGVRDNVGYAPAATLPLLAEVLAQQGWATGAAVSSYVLRREAGLARGFAVYDDAVPTDPRALSFDALQRPGAATVDRALAFVRERTTLTPSQPLFLFVHLYDPHTPHDPPEPFRSRYGASYDGDVATADAAVGRLVAGLRELGRWDDALVVLVSDHGEGLGDHGEKEHGLLLYREALHVPLFVRLPGGRRGGETIDAPATLVDLPATILDLAAVDAPELVGRGVALLSGEPVDAHRELYAETLYPRLQFGWSELRSLVADGHQLIDGPDPELYDLAADPAQRENRREADRRRFSDLRRRLRSYPLDLAPPAGTDPETAKRLQALGYVNGGAPVDPDGPRADPKSRVEVMEALKAALATAVSGDHAAAAAGLRAITVQEPQLELAWRQLGQELERVGDMDGALAAYEHSLALTGAPPATLLAVGELYVRLGRFDDAARHATALAAVEPVGAALLRTRIAHARGRWDEAVAEAERALLAVPREAVPPRELNFLRGDALARLGRNADAIAAFRFEIASHPDVLAAYTSLAFVQALGGDRAGARDTLGILVAANRTPQAARLAVESLRLMGESEAAASVLAEALTRHPADPELTTLAAH